MECLSCGKEMKIESYEGAGIERCFSCGGVWLNAAELDKIVNTHEVEFSPQQVREAFLSSVKEKKLREDLLKDVKSFKRDVNLDKLSDDEILVIFKKRWGISRKIKCPKCKTFLEEFDYKETGIILDRCPKQHGVWLDSTELVKVQIIIESYKRMAMPEDLKRGTKGSFWPVMSKLGKWFSRFKKERRQ